MKSKIHDLEIYSLSMKLGEEIWEIVLTWDFFARDTVGKQWVRAIDSVASNISEGYGRYSYIEMRKFVIIARGSILEHFTWMTKASNRGLISAEVYTALTMASKRLSVKINNYLTSLNVKIQKTTEHRKRTT